MRLYISADIEGIAAVVSREHQSPEGFEYDQARTWMTDAVLAAAEAARECGVAEVVVSDSHGNMQNLKLDRLPQFVRVVRGRPRPLSMMQGIEVGQYAAAMFIGYHAGSTALKITLTYELLIQSEPKSDAFLRQATSDTLEVPLVTGSSPQATP